MKINSVAILGAGAVGSYMIWGLSSKKDLRLVANQIGLDPAIMASPLITTIVDTCSILVYFNVAMHIFNL